MHATLPQVVVGGRRQELQGGGTGAGAGAGAEALGYHLPGMLHRGVAGQYTHTAMNGMNASTTHTTNKRVTSSSSPIRTGFR